MSAAPTTYAWKPVTTVSTDGIFRFVALVPPSWTADQLEAYLDPDFGGKLGWDVKSVSVPPANVTAALQAAGTVFPNGQVPAAFWVTAAWPGGPGALAPDPQLTYEQLSQYVPVAAGTPGGSSDPVPSPDEFPPEPTASSDVAIAVLGFGALAFLGWLVWKESSGINAGFAPSRRAVHANPIQTITVPVNGRKVPFRIDTDGVTWKALADLHLGRKRKLIVGEGATKSEALHNAIAKTSSVFASLDV